MSAKLLVLAVLLAVAPAVQEEEALSPRAEKKIIKLIRTAVSQKEAGAAKAQESLVDLGAAAVPLLRQALDEERDRSYTILYILNRIYQKEAGREWKDLPARRDTQKRQGTKYLQGKFEEAKRVQKGGGHARALKMLDAILVLEPELGFKQEVESLRVKVKASLYHSSVLTASFETEEEAYEVGGIIEVKVRLRNPGQQTLVIPLPGEGTNLGVLNLERRIYKPDGNWVTDYQTETLPLPEQIEIEPGESYDLLYLIDVRGIDLPEGFYVSLWLSGRLRPPSLIQGEKNRARLIEIPRKEVPLLPVGQGNLAADPFERLKENLEEDHDLTAELTGLDAGDDARRGEITGRLAAISVEILPLAFLSARDALWPTNEALVGALEQASPATGAAAMTGLSFLNGKEPTLQKRQWQIWWLKVE